MMQSHPTESNRPADINCNEVSMDLFYAPTTMVWGNGEKETRFWEAP
jgi:hypothetical protein